jgi:hypothetical protein
MARAPRDGDPTICGYCASFGIITDERVRQPNATEERHIKRLPHMLQVQQALIGMMHSAASLN